MKFQEIPINKQLKKMHFILPFDFHTYKMHIMKELKEHWHHGAHKLKKINISPSNGKFIFKDKKYLLGKSGENKDEFDILLFASRDIEEISIPSDIKIISLYAFYMCENLTKVEIPTNSNLQAIG